MDDFGNRIGSAIKLANERWAPFDKDEKERLVNIGVSFKTPNEVLKFFKMKES